MAEKITKNNLFLVNAPAGSGKTTFIENLILDKLSLNTKKNILCITYTNRAADELMSRIQSEKVQIQTIHSFFSSFMKSYFSNKEIVNLYLKLYREDIQARIENKENKDYVNESNQKYREDNGELSYEFICNNLHKIYYNELSSNSLYKGGLSHDDLITFSKETFKRFPILKRRIAAKYDYIFIDEYQDSASNVLDIFYQSILNTDTQLYLFGDKMQQIYKNYDGNFENQLEEFDTSIKLHTNYRSSELIVTILNNIYNDEKFKQIPNEQIQTETLFPPKVYICNDMKNTVAVESEKNPNALKLYVFNKDRFYDIGARNLFDSISKMEKYSFGRKYSVQDVLTTPSNDNPDELFKFLFLIGDILDYFKNKQYGNAIQLIRNNHYLNNTILLVNFHKDKELLKEKMTNIFNFSIDKEGCTIKEYLEFLLNAKVTTEDEINHFLNSEEHAAVLAVKLIEFENLYQYLKNPNVSTQHGVKGEGHDSVFFVAGNSSNIPRVEMYRYFALWTEINVSLTEFQKFYYDFSFAIQQILKQLGCKSGSEIKKELFKENEQLILKELRRLDNTFEGNKYFSKLYAECFNVFYEKPNIKNLKPCLNIHELLGILSAYKLFYVGCSRAKKELTVFIDRSQLLTDVEIFSDKLQEIGFKVENR